jgi:hypothetical protein
MPARPVGGEADVSGSVVHPLILVHVGDFPDVLQNDV